MSRIEYMDIALGHEYNPDIRDKMIFGKYAYTSKQILYYAEKFTELKNGAVSFDLALWKMHISSNPQDLDGGTTCA